MRLNIWEKRFKELIRQSHVELFKTKVQAYIDEGHTFEEAYHRAANDELPQLRRRLRKSTVNFE
jgi:hypothetical protein